MDYIEIREEEKHDLNTSELKDNSCHPQPSLNKVLLSSQWKFDSVIKVVPGNMVMAAFDMYKESPCGSGCTRLYKNNFNYFVSFWPQ